MDYSFLSKTVLFNGITAKETELLLKCTDAFEKNYEKDEIILHAGSPCVCMGIVVSGSVNIIVNY